MEKTLKLTGPKAVVALLIIVGVTGFQYISRAQSVQTQAVHAIKTQLAADYTRYHLPELQQAATAGTMDATSIEKVAADVNPDKIDIVSMHARGHNGDYIARVEIRVDGSAPPDGRSVRYFKIRHSSLTGWHVANEAHPWNYYLAF